jgi:hypothetical protein
MGNEKWEKKWFKRSEILKIFKIFKSFLKTFLERSRNFRGSWSFLENFKDTANYCKLEGDSSLADCIFGTSSLHVNKCVNKLLLLLALPLPVSSTSVAPAPAAPALLCYFVMMGDPHLAAVPQRSCASFDHCFPYYFVFCFLWLMESELFKVFKIFKIFKGFQRTFLESFLVL